ncbi:MAG TPA: hypothetical protein VNH65_01135 [Candidatus Acidoferrum sp.]|nr:hypothetical protein [Candidatus Acidoferrum sp.]
MRGIPGKYKRVLTAIANRARNDGTNFFEAKETIGAKSGVDRSTAFRNMDDLTKMGILPKAESHECGIDYCPKGTKHFYKPGNHWTQVYYIDLVALQKYDELRCKMLREKKKSGVAKRTRVALQNATEVALHFEMQTGDTREARFTGSVEPSVLTDGSKKASKPVTLATASLAPASLAALENQSQNLLGYGNLSSEEQNQEQPEYQFPQSREEMYDAPMSDASELLHIITPNVTDAMVREQLPLCARILEFFPRADEYAVKAAELVLGFNRAHRSGKYATKDDKKLYIRNAAQYLKALESSTASLLNDYDNHDFKNCETCRESGVFDYKAFVREIRKDQEREAARKKQEKLAAIEREKRLAEEARIAKLCPECKKADRGEHLMYSIGGWVKVCDACYDKRYESEQNTLADKGWYAIRQPLKPRPEYLAAKEAEAKAAMAKAMEDAEEDVPICPQCHRAGKNVAGYQKHWDNCPVYREELKQAFAQPLQKEAAKAAGEQL